MSTILISELSLVFSNKSVTFAVYLGTLNSGEISFQGFRTNFLSIETLSLNFSVNINKYFEVIENFIGENN